MKSLTLTLRFVPLLCILATFPALGQVENAEDTRTAVATAPDARAPGNSWRLPESASQAIQAPRLVADDPSITDLPRVEMVERAAVTPPRSIGAAPAVGRAAPAQEGNASPYDRIAALSAVVPREPTARPPGPAPVTALEVASAWIADARAYLDVYWRQVGLVSAMLLTAGLLFWRLGERSRHDEQELVLEASAPTDAVEISAEPLRFEQEPDASDLPAMPAIRMASEMPQALAEASAPVIRPARQHATLREAISAMKAEMEKSAVDA
jgi:hypothetical protein